MDKRQEIDSTIYPVFYAIFRHFSLEKTPYMAYRIAAMF